MIAYDDVAARLMQFGCGSIAGNDSTAVIFAIDRAAERRKANINRAEIPAELNCTWIDMAVGFFLFDKKAAGQLDGQFDFAAPAKKITEGDVSVEFAGQSDGRSTPEARLDSLINRLINPPPYIFSRFRRFIW